MSTPIKRAIVIWWREIDRWVVPSTAILSRRLPTGWIRVRVGDVVKLVSNVIKVEPDVEYKMAGVKWYGEGVFHRETVRGDALSARWISPLVPGALIYNRLFAWKESFAIVPADLADCHVSNEFPQFVTDPTTLLSKYLYLWCISDQTIKAVNVASTGSAAVSRNRFREEFFLNFNISLPPLLVQHKVVETWETEQRGATETAAKIEQLEHDIETNFMASMGIGNRPFSRRNRYFVLPWQLVERWGVEFNLWEWSLGDLFEGNYPLLPLNELAWINPVLTTKLEQSAKVTFVPMEAVDAEEGEITRATHRKVSEVKQGFTSFQEGDVIWAKITPCMQNGKCAVAKSLMNGVGYGSTEFHVIRPKDVKKLIPDFLWALLRLRRLREAAQRYFIGSAGQQRVPPDFLRELPIPVVPVNLQHQIVERIVKQRKEITKLKAEAKARDEVARADVELMILGTKKVSEL